MTTNGGKSGVKKYSELWIDFILVIRPWLCRLAVISVILGFTYESLKCPAFGYSRRSTVREYVGLVALEAAHEECFTCTGYFELAKDCTPLSRTLAVTHSSTFDVY